jgi:hypothetical protein
MQEVALHDIPRMLRGQNIDKKGPGINWKGRSSVVLDENFTDLPGTPQISLPAVAMMYGLTPEAVHTIWTNEQTVTDTSQNPILLTKRDSSDLGMNAKRMARKLVENQTTKGCKGVHSGSENSALAMPMPAPSPVRKFTTFSYRNIEPIINPMVQSVTQMPESAFLVEDEDLHQEVKAVYICLRAFFPNILRASSETFQLVGPKLSTL